MIIDSHVHYTHSRFDGEFLYLCEREGKWDACRGTREDLLSALKEQGITGFIEPSIRLEGIEKQKSMAAKDDVWAAFGVHPTRCIHTPWRARRLLSAYAERGEIVAVGETGLDYHLPRKEQHRLWQKRWFVYQLKLADRLQCPLILHIREAGQEALRILERHRSKLHGGVVHCFSGDFTLAKRYINLGFSFGIGGKLLANDDAGCALRETVKHLPLESILVETDAPFVLPDLEGLSCIGKQRRRLCNSSLILPAVIREIAALRGEDAALVEETVYRNTLRVFRLREQEGRADAE